VDTAREQIMIHGMIVTSLVFVIRAARSEEGGG
jgi:hypothetical protein